MESNSQPESMTEATTSLAAKLNRDVLFARETLPAIDVTLECIDSEYPKRLIGNTKNKKEKADLFYEAAQARKELLKNTQILYSDLDLSPGALHVGAEILRLMQMFVKMQSEKINFESSALVSDLLQSLNDYEVYSLSIKSDKLRRIKILEKLYPIFKILQTQTNELKALVSKYQTLLEPKQFTFPKLLKKYSTHEAMESFDSLIGLAIQVSTNTALDKDHPNSLYKLLISPLNSLVKSLINTRDMISNNYALADNAFELESLYVSLNQLEKIFEKIDCSNIVSEMYFLTNLMSLSSNDIHHSQIYFIRAQAYEGLKTPHADKLLKLQNLEQKLEHLSQCLLHLPLEDQSNLIQSGDCTQANQILEKYDESQKKLARLKRAIPQKQSS
jgi:hypothetical protein